MKNFHILKFSLLVLFFSISANVFAQTDTKVSTNDEKTATLDVTLVDYYGRYVKDYKGENFQVFLDKTEQKILSVEQNDQPISIGFLIDLSGSSENKVNVIQHAVTEFLNGSNTENEYFLVTFNKEISERIDFTTDAEKIFDEVKSFTSKDVKGNTMFYDAVALGISKMQQAKYEKRVLFILSDGRDNLSESSFKQVLKNAKRERTIIYTVGLLDGYNRLITGSEGESAMDELAHISGGKSFYPNSLVEVKEISQRIALELRSQYKIKFKLNNESYRKLKEKDKGIKINLELKEKNIISTDLKGKEKKVKLSVRHSEELFLNDVESQITN